jgi:hypothetical protein
MSSRPTPTFLLALTAAAMYAASLSLPAFTCASTVSFPAYMILLMGWTGLDPRWLGNIGMVLVLIATLKPVQTRRPALAMATSVLAVASVIFPALGCTGMDTPNLSTGLAAGGYLWVAALLLAGCTNAVTIPPRGWSKPETPSPAQVDETPSDRMFAHGECSNCPEQEEMAEILARHGLAVSLGQYSIYASDCEVFRFENWMPPGNWTLDGTAARPEVLWRDARLVSKALTDAGIRHWLGIYDDVQNEMGYLHFEWPDEDLPATH